MLRCSMCGYDFDPTDLACHSSCPLGGGCMVICCPRCGYSMVNPERSTALAWFKRLWRRPPSTPAPASDGSLPLLGLRPGQDGRVVSLGEGQPDQMLHLSHFGLLPGVPIRLRQSKPVPIIQIGATDLALDTAVAACIFVEPLSSPHQGDAL